MKGKLFKMVEGYTLSLTGSIDDLYGISNKQLAEDHQLHKLSLKNCQAIENGYDLDEKIINHLEDNHIEASTRRVDVIKTLILELLGDKKFSEGDMINAVLYGTQKGLDFGKVPETDNDWVRNYIKSQKNKWDVEIEMFTSDDLKSVEDDWVKLNKLKLDEDGCLILKRI